MPKSIDFLRKYIPHTHTHTHKHTHDFFFNVDHIYAKKKSKFDN